jgi:hypothetical protein
MIFISTLIGDRFLRVVPIQSFLQSFSSNRSHMFNKETNLWLSDPPEWPLICGELASSPHNLEEYLSCDELDDKSYGTVYSLEEFAQWCQGLEIRDQQPREEEVPSVDEMLDEGRTVTRNINN